MAGTDPGASPDAWWLSAPVDNGAQPPAQTTPSQPSAAPAPGGNWWEAAPVDDGSAPPVTATPGASAPPSPAPPAGPGFLKTVDDYMGAVANGLSLGFADRIGAAGDALIGRGSYSDNLARNRGTLAAEQAAHPVGFPVAQTLAGAALPMGAVGEMGAAGSLGGRVAQGIGMGTLTGAASGAAASPDFTKPVTTAEDAAIGAGLGGVAGLGMTAAGAGLGAAYRGALRQAVPDVMGPNGPMSLEAQRIAGNAMQADGLPAVQQRADALGPLAMPADYGPSLQGIARGLAVKPGAPGEQVVQALGTRNAGTDGRLRALLNGSLGPAQSPDQYVEGLKADGNQIASRLPGLFAAAPPLDISPVVAQLDRRAQTAVGPELSAIGHARGWLTRPAPTSPGSLWEPDPVGSGTVPPQPDMPQAPLENGVRGPAPQTPSMPRPQSMVNFVQGLGGVQDPGGDLTSMSLNRFPGLVTGNGVSPDMARQAAAEAGYLGAHTDDAVARSDINDFMDRLANHPAYSVQDDPAVHAWETYDAARSNWDQQGTPTSQPARPPSAPGFPDAGPSAAPAAPQPGGVPISDPATIFNAKKALDNAIDYGSPGLGIDKSAVTDAQGAFKQARGGVNDVLRAGVPGYSDNMDQLAGLNRQREAVQSGLDAFGAGKQAARPDDFADQFDALSPGEQDGFRVGARHEVDRAFGTAPDKLQVLQSLLQGPGGWNASKLASTFGDDAAGRFQAGLAAEQTMSDTGNQVAQSAAAAKQQAMAKLLADPDWKPNELPHVGDVTPHGMAMVVPRWLANEGYKAMQSAPDNSIRDGDLADFITSQGPTRMQVMADLLKAQGAREANAAIDPSPFYRGALIGSGAAPSALVAALLAHRSAGQ